MRGAGASGTRNPQFEPIDITESEFVHIWGVVTMLSTSSDSPASLWALVDCNNFYASCEKLFRPDLADRPVVVLSNNDGCIVARSAEAKALGIPMGAPEFKLRARLQELNVAVFSSNYALYGDISARVTGILEQCCPHVEPYSIDEAFMRLDAPQRANLPEFCREVPRAALDGDYCICYMDSREDAIEFARKELEVTVVW